MKNLLDIVRIDGIIEEGVTTPIRCRLSDSSDAVVKYPRNRFGIEVLVNEWIGNCIADTIGLLDVIAESIVMGRENK